ncbi:MAG: hypothetical protein ACOYNU_15325 [Bacteroidales bacterium]
MVLGIWGVGTVEVSYVIMMNDLNANYQRTYPQQLVLTSANFEKLDLARFIARPEIEAAEFRDFSLHRIEISPDVWIPRWLYGVENFDDFKLARVFREEGNNTPLKGTMLIERDGKKVSAIRLGSNPRVRIGGRNFRIPVSGICFDPGQVPAVPHLCPDAPARWCLFRCDRHPAGCKVGLRLRLLCGRQTQF